MNTHNSEKTRMLMMASIDGEATAEQEAKLRKLLLEDNALAEEYQQLKQLKTMTSQNKLKEPLPELWDTYNHRLFIKAERGLGWILLTIGAVLLLFFGAWTALSDLFTDPETPLWLKAGIGALVAGTIILLVSLLRERFYLNKHERYKDIVR